VNLPAMRISTSILASSVLINVGLLIVIAFGAVSDRGSAKQSMVASLASRPVPVQTAVATGDWRDIESNDLQTERDRLRREGFPAEFIRAILAAQIHESFAAQRKALEADTADVAFWKTPIPDPKTQAALRALAKQEQKTLNDLLGPDLEYGPIASLHRLAPNLSQDKLEQLAAILARYEDQRSEIFATMRGSTGLLSGEGDKLSALEKAKHGEFAAVLTPTELEDYDLRASRTANNLRNELNAFNPTEQEFRTLYQLKSVYDEQFGMMYGPASPDQAQARRDAQKQLSDQIAAALGPERYADYQRTTDYDYLQTTRLVARLELPPATADQVYAMQKDIQQRADAIRNTAAPEDRNAQLAALAAEAQAKVAAALGPTGFEAYKTNGGQWLQSIAVRRTVKGQMSLRPGP
jgi:hypothetical protein